MKWLFILFSIFKPFLSSGGSHEMPNPIEDFKDLVKKNAVKVMLTFGAVSAMATVFAAGLLMIAVDIGAQFDDAGFVRFSAVISLGITMMLLPVLVGAILVKKYDSDNEEDEIKKRPALQHVGTVHPLQDALALLIHDFVKEREMKRAHEEAAPRGPVTEERRHTPVRETSPTVDDFRH